MFVILGDNCNCNFYFDKMEPFLRQMQMQMYFFLTHLVIFPGNSSSKHFSYKKLLSLQSSSPSLFCLIRTVPTLSLFSSKPTGPCTTKNTIFYLKCTRIFKKNWGILLFKSSFCLHAKQFFSLPEIVAISRPWSIVSGISFLKWRTKTIVVRESVSLAIF